MIDKSKARGHRLKGQNTLVGEAKFLSAPKINHSTFDSAERTSVADDAKSVGAYSPASALSILLPGLFIPECVQVDTDPRPL